VRGPARGRNLEDARVVDRAGRWIEVWVLPDGDEFGIADGVGPRCGGEVHGVPNRGQLAVDDPAPVLVAPDHVVDLLLRLAVPAQTSLDDLDAIEVAAESVFERGDEERRRLAGRRSGKIAAHRHTLRVAGHRPRARRVWRLPE